MPEKRCAKCNGVISHMASVCPHCGAKVRTGTGTGVGLVVGLLVLGGAVALVITLSRHPLKLGGGPRTVVVRRTSPVAPPAPEPPAPPPEPAPVVSEPPPPEPAPPPKPKLTKGMTMDQVRQAMGEPAKESSAQAADIRFDWWQYPSGEKLRFVNSVLDGWTVNEPSPAAGALAALTSPAPVASGGNSSTDTRKQIYAELKIAMKRAEVEGAINRGPASQKDSLKETYAELVRKKYSITEAQQQAILAEGDKEHWPLPAVVFGAPVTGGTVSVGSSYTTGMMLELLLAADTGGVLRNVEGSLPLPIGSRLHIVRAQASNYTTWFYVEVLSPTGGVAAKGWLSGLVTLDVGGAAGEPPQPPATPRRITG